MKNDKFLIANPTKATITIDAISIEEGRVKEVTIEDEEHSAYLAEWICKGCVVAPATKTNATATVTDVVDSEVQLVQKGAFLLQELTRAVLSAGDNTFAEYGL